MPKKNKSDKCKHSLLLENAVIDEMRAEAERQGRSLSWVVRQAWKMTKHRLDKSRAAEG